MSLFDKFFGSSRQCADKRQFKKTHANVEATYGPMAKVAMAIVTAASEVQNNLATIFGFRMDGQPSERQILLFYEFLYFFAHLTLRSGVARGLTASQVKKFQSYLGPLLASTAVDTFFLHWSTELKAKMMGEFFEKLNDAEIEYAECQGGLVSRDDPFSRDTLTGRLAVNVVELWERSGDQVAKTAVVSAVTGALKRVDLVRLVSEVVAKIDQVENEPGI